MPQPRKKQLVLALNKIQNECQFSMLFVLDSVIGLQLKQFEEQIIFPQLVSQRRGHLQMDLDNSLKKVFSIKPKLRISHSLYCCSQTFPNAYASNVLDFLYYYYYYFFFGTFLQCPTDRGVQGIFTFMFCFCFCKKCVSSWLSPNLRNLLQSKVNRAIIKIPSQLLNQFPQSSVLH